MSAIVWCLFKVLSTHPNREVLDQSSQIIKKAQSVRSHTLDIALYDSAKFFILNGPSTKMKADVVSDEISDNKNPSSGSEGALATVHRVFPGESSEAGDQRPPERFQPLVLAVLACPLEPWLQPERSRKSRAELALALTGSAAGALRDPATLAAILDPWIAEERSRPLREDLERARQPRKRQL